MLFLGSTLFSRNSKKQSSTEAFKECCGTFKYVLVGLVLLLFALFDFHHNIGYLNSKVTDV